VAVETDKNLIVVALLAAGFTVYPINPRAVARYRERHGQAGGKSDPGDAIVLAHILRTDRHRHRPMPVSSETALAVKALARQHQEAIWARQHTVNRLRSVLLEYYPNALDAFPNLTHRAALTILAAVPSPARAAKLTIKKTVTLLRRCGRGDRPGLAEQIVRDLTAATLRQPLAVEEALATATVGLVSVITAMETVIAELEVAMVTEFDRHRHAELLRSVPGLGPVLAARVLAEIGDDPNRFATASGLCAFAGTAPITRASGRTKTVNARHIRNRRLGDARHWWAFAALTKSPGARAHYDRRRASRRRPQRGATKPRQQTPQPTLVVPPQQPNLGRNRRLASSHNTTHEDRCLTTHRREVSTSSPPSSPAPPARHEQPQRVIPTAGVARPRPLCAGAAPDGSGITGRSRTPSTRR
jgi:transposase